MSQIPLTILTGFLGAGKTTLLNRILASDRGLRVAVLVNDFGSVNVDAELIEELQDDIISLANGCTCCTIRDDLTALVVETINRPEPPDHIVVEASGVADPSGLVMALSSPELTDRIRLDSVTCVVDADEVFAHPEQPHVNQLKLLQIAFADLVVLNKATLAGPTKLKAARAWINQHFNGIRMFEADYCAVPDEVLLGTNRLDAEIVSDAPAGHAPAQSDEAPAYDSWTYATDSPLSLALLEQAVAQLPATVYRCKGIVRSDEHPDRPAVLQVVSRRVDVSLMDRWRHDPATRVVVIAARGSIDATALQDVFDVCVVDKT